MSATNTNENTNQPLVLPVSRMNISYDQPANTASDQAQTTEQQPAQVKAAYFAKNGDELRHCSDPSDLEKFDAKHPHDITTDIRKEKYGANHGTDFKSYPSAP